MKIFLVIIGLLIGMAACGFMVYWINTLSGCIFNINIWGLCVIDSLLITIFASLGLTAFGILIQVFLSRVNS